jgi:hypothetical protein
MPAIVPYIFQDKMVSFEQSTSAAPKSDSTLEEREYRKTHCGKHSKLIIVSSKPVEVLD